jgi:hypothetical protein
MIPWITEAEVVSWSAQRVKAPFTGVEDFKTRSGLSPASLASFSF